MAPHCLGLTRKTTLQPVVLQFLIAASSACFWFASFQLKPYLPVASSRANAPYSAKAGAALASTKRAAAKPAAVSIARRIVSVLLRAFVGAGLPMAGLRYGCGTSRATAARFIGPESSHGEGQRSRSVGPGPAVQLSRPHGPGGSGRPRFRVRPGLRGR